MTTTQSITRSPHASPEPSDWIRRFEPLFKREARVLDLACGSGRHLRWLAARGHAVTGVDRDAAALAGMQGLGELITADLEAGVWPLGGRRFDAVVVTNYLWRPGLPAVVGAVDAGGWLLYETFADGQQTVGRPSNPQFLLQPGELLRACAGLHIVAYEDGWLDDPARCVQRIAAYRPQPDAACPRLPLNPAVERPTPPGAGGAMPAG